LHAKAPPKAAVSWFAHRSRTNRQKNGDRSFVDLEHRLGEAQVEARRLRVLDLVDHQVRLGAPVDGRSDQVIERRLVGVYVPAFAHIEQNGCLDLSSGRNRPARKPRLERHQLGARRRKGRVGLKLPLEFPQRIGRALPLSMEHARLRSYGEKGKGTRSQDQACGSVQTVFQNASRTHGVVPFVEKKHRADPVR
jgi:hypothetical protein